MDPSMANLQLSAPLWQHKYVRSATACDRECEPRCSVCTSGRKNQLLNGARLDTAHIQQ